MPEFRWKAQYALGIENIDSQHKMIMDKFNALYDAIHNHDNKDTVAKLMVEVMECAQTHFLDEEALFANNRYPKENEQKMAHQSFKRKSEAIYSAFLQNKIVNTVDLVALLMDWIENHMLTMDMEYKEFMVRLELLNKITGSK